MTNDSLATTTSTTKTGESNVSSIYHEKRVSSDANSTDTAPDTDATETPTTLPVRDAYLVDTTLHIVVDANLAEKVVEINLPITETGSIDSDVFKRPETNSYDGVIKFLLTTLNNTPKNLTEIHSITGNLKSQGEQLQLIVGGETTETYELNDPLPEEEREPLTPALNTLTAISQYYANEMRGIETELQNYTENGSNTTSFSIDASVSPTITATFTFDVDGIEIDPETDTTTRLIEHAGEGDPTFLPGSRATVIHSTDVKYTNDDSDVQYIETSDDGEWVLLLPDDHQGWWDAWVETHTETETDLISYFKSGGFIAASLMIGGGVVAFAAAASFLGEPGSLSYEMGHVIIRIGLAVMVLSAIVGAISLLGTLVFFATDFPTRYLNERKFEDYTTHS